VLQACPPSPHPTDHDAYHHQDDLQGQHVRVAAGLLHAGLLHGGLLHGGLLHGGG
jgi:hypothetical protein